MRMYTMGVKAKTADQQEGKRYLVACDGCELEQTALGREEATQSADTHHRETGHDLIVVEWPRATAPS